MVQSMLAEMYVWVESMRLYTYQVLRAANTVSEGESGRGDIHKLTAAGVMYTAETRSEEHTSELQSLMRISYAVFCLKKKIKNTQQTRLQDALNYHRTTIKFTSHQ